MGIERERERNGKKEGEGERNWMWVESRMKQKNGWMGKDESSARVLQRRTFSGATVTSSDRKKNKLKRTSYTFSHLLLSFFLPISLVLFFSRKNEMKECKTKPFLNLSFLSGSIFSLFFMVNIE